MLKGSGDSPQFALDNLDPGRIRLARERLGYTGKKLAEQVQITPSAVSQFESGVTLPDLETLVRIAMALGVPTTFFVRRPRRVPTVQFDACHFRARRHVSQRERRASAAQASILLEMADILERHGIVFPEERLSSFSDVLLKAQKEREEWLENAASALRKHWGMGFGPIPNLTRVLESKGVFVFPLADVHQDVDAFSTWAGTRPCVMLALNKGASRARFDAAHELAHLVMHDDTEPGNARTEREADRFAGAFLAPREGFLAECPRQWSFEAFKRLKVRWRMSIAALVRRAYDLRCLSESSYHRAFKSLTTRGIRLNEPDEWDHDPPVLFSQALELLLDKLGLQTLSSQMTLSTGEVERLLKRSVAEEVIVGLKREVPSGPFTNVRIREL